MDIVNMTALEIGELIKLRKLSAAEAADEFIKQIKLKDKEYNCYITWNEEAVRSRAREVQGLIDNNMCISPLAGVPVAVKDNICTKGLRTTAGSKMLEHFVPPYSAHVVEALERAGAVIIGKTNMDEFGMGSTTESSYYGVTRNPHDTTRVAGGSSGGSAAAVALSECAYALGSDTGGSVRLPSAYCGVVGMKPTYGSVSRYGLIAYASSLEQIAPITKDVADCASVLEAIVSYDEKDSTSVKGWVCDLKNALVSDVKGLRIGIPVEYFGYGLDAEVRERIMEAVKLLEAKGAIVEEFSLDYVKYALPAYYTIASSEASSNLARYDGVKYGYRTETYTGLHDMYKKTRLEGFGGEVKRRIMLGSFALSAGYYDEFYLKALKVKEIIKKEFNKAFERYDIILSPVAPATAPHIGENINDPIKMYQGDIYTVTANLIGIPAISLPCGRSSSGLPIGMQLMGRPFDEKTLLRAAYAYEQAVK